MKNLLKCLALLAGLFAFAAPARAAETWVPAFNPAQKIYVDPLMKQRVSLNSDFEQKLEQTARDHGLGLDVYVVIAQRGEELANLPASSWAAALTDNRLLTAWRYAPGYQEKNVEIIVYLRDANSDAGSIFVHSGTDLLGYGITGSLLSSASGPVLPAARTYMRTDPQTGILTIQNNVVLQAVSNGSTTYFLGLSLGVWIIIIIIVLVLIVLIAAGGSGGGGGFFVGGGGGCSSCTGGSSGGGDGGGGDC